MREGARGTWGMGTRDVGEGEQGHERRTQGSPGIGGNGHTGYGGGDTGER